MARRSNEELLADNLQPRKKGEGTVFEVKSRPGVYRAVRVIEIDGKAVQISGTGMTPEQAIQKRERNVFKKLAGKPAAAHINAKAIQQSVSITKSLSSESTFHEILLDWLEWRRYQTSPSKKISGAVRKQYETHIRKHLGPSEMGQTPLNQLTRPIIENYFFRELPRNTKTIWRDGEQEVVPTLSISNQRAQQSIVNMALNYAVYPLSLIPSNPSTGMDRIRKEDNVTANTDLEKKRKMAYTLARILRGEPDEARWLFQLLTGCRQSEALGATWGESFLYLFEEPKPGKPPTFIVKQQLARDPFGEGLKIAHRTKSRSSTRVIPLDPRLVEVLREHKQRQDQMIADLRDHPDPKRRWNPLPGMEDLVFCEPTGRPTAHQTDHKRWKSVLHRFKFELEGDEISLHGLRHLCASILATTPGVTIEQIKNILGHASTVVTSAVYLHIGAQNLVSPIANFTSAIFRDREAEEKGLPIPPYSDEEFFGGR
jgi:integrase